MKTITLILAFSCAAFAQTQQQGRPGQPQRPQNPSSAVTAPLPAQDLTVCIAGDCTPVTLTSDQITAVEKDRRDHFHAVVNDQTGETTLAPNNSTLSAHIAQQLSAYLQLALRRYPGADLAAKQKAVKDAQDQLINAEKTAATVKATAQ